MEDFKAALFNIIEGFNSDLIQVNWPEAWDTEELFDTIQDALETIIHNIAFLPGISEQERERLAGKLVISEAKLSFYYGHEDKREGFIHVGHELEQVLKEILNTLDWISLAKDRFDEYEVFEREVAAGKEPSLDKLDYFRPVFNAIAYMMIITADQEQLGNNQF